MQGWIESGQRCAVCRRRPVVAGICGGWWVHDRSENRAWREATIGRSPTQCNVSGFFGHANGSIQDIKIPLKGEERVSKSIVVQKARSEY